MNIPKILQQISNRLLSINAEAVAVGGVVRDHFLKLPTKDYDIEVFGLEDIEELEKILSEFGRVNLVGKSFGVLKLRVKEIEFDFSIPRREEKIAKGHRGFSVDLYQKLDFKEASKRRDFTINAIGFNINSKEFLDPHGGIGDLKRGKLKHIDSKKFQEDPLRVYRGVQFLARFNLKIERETFDLCSNIVKNGHLDELPKERVFIEFKKLLLKPNKPSIGFELMRELKILDRYYPELLEVNFKKIDRVSKYKNLKLIFATIGFFIPNKIEPFLKKITSEKRLIKEVLELVDTLREYQNIKTWNRRYIKELSTKIEIDEFLKVYKTLRFKNYRYIKRVAKNLNIYNSKLKPLIIGKDLIALGFKPSKEFSKILKEIYKMQIVGEINSKREAIEFLKCYYLQKE